MPYDDEQDPYSTDTETQSDPYSNTDTTTSTDPYSDDTSGEMQMPEDEITPGSPDVEFSDDEITPTGHPSKSQMDAQGEVNKVLGPLLDEVQDNPPSPSPWENIPDPDPELSQKLWGGGIE